jgi:hypothetical protein
MAGSHANTSRLLAHKKRVADHDGETTMSASSTLKLPAPLTSLLTNIKNVE